MIENTSVAIPMSVWRDKSLNTNHIKLYGELVLLGGGTLTNGELSERLDCHKMSVSRWLSDLVAAGHIERRLKRDSLGMVVRRDIYLTAGVIQDTRPEEGGINSEVKGVNSGSYSSILNSYKKQENKPLKGADAPGGEEVVTPGEKLGQIPNDAPEVYASGDVNISKAMKNGMTVGYGPIKKRFNNWDRLETKLREKKELTAPDLLMVFRKIYREKHLGEYPHSQMDVNKMKVGFLGATKDISTGGRLKIIEYYLDRHEYRHKDWEIESEPTVGIMIGYLKQYMSVALGRR